MRNSSTATPPVPARQVPTKLTSAPASSRPAAKAATSAWGSNAWLTIRTSISAPAHGRQEGDLVAIGHRPGQIVRHALIDDQARAGCGHRLTQQRLLARHPSFEVIERV